MPKLPKRRTCGSVNVDQRLTRTHKPYRRNRLMIEYHAADQFLRAARRGIPAVLTIPVVVHVVSRVPAENVSAAQIQTQITALNQDYRRLNPDVKLVPAAFKPLIGDARITFKLAARDPRGNRTTGITRTRTGHGPFVDDDQVKSAATGGHDPWPWNSYLNLWVCNLGGGLLGYAQFPGGPAATDGVVINYAAFGTSGTATAPYDKGRSATHEIGHWLNLRHIWGDDPQCKLSDEVSDTPNQSTPNYGKPIYPHISCGNGPRGDMFMDYMDYTDDAAMFMFSTGQVTRMQAALRGPRSGLAASSKVNLRAPAKARAKKKSARR